MISKASKPPNDSASNLVGTRWLYGANHVNHTLCHALYSLKGRFICELGRQAEDRYVRVEVGRQSSDVEELAVTAVR